MTTATNAAWQRARKEPFEALGILYYPLFRSRADLPTEIDDEDMAWAVTANTNLKGTGYLLSQPSILALAAYHHAVAALAHTTPLLPLAALAEGGINPLADLQRLVPDITATPMYPDFPKQVMQISEAQFRYHQACHYLSTYGVEQLAGMVGLDVSVGKGWLPKVRATEKTREDKTIMAPKVLHVLVTVEDLQAVVAARLARATRMHPAEIQTALLVFEGLGDEDCTSIFPQIAFHENMMELIRTAAQEDSATLERVAVGLAQHPGDLLKATRYLVEHNPKNHLRTKQKKGLCRAFEHFSTMSIAKNLADAGSSEQRAPNYLSLERFGGAHLREAVELVESGQVRSWASELESLWDELDCISDPRRRKDLQGFFSHLSAGAGDAGSNVLLEDFERIQQMWRRLLAHYGLRPGMLFRSIARLIKAQCPPDMLIDEVMAHAESYALPTIVRTLTVMSERDPVYRVTLKRHSDFSLAMEATDEHAYRVRERICSILRELLVKRLAAINTPLRGKCISLDTAGISLKGSVLVPNETGETGTAWPPVGMAWDLPQDKTVRFFIFWDDRSKRVDVDLHFVGRTLDGNSVNVGWNSSFRSDGLVTSGDITTSCNSVEFLDANISQARDAGVHVVVQEQQIFSGAQNWGDISTCYTGAAMVSGKARNIKLVNPKNFIFRDDMTGEGKQLAYAVINFPAHYVRILRGSKVPLGDVGFSLGDYLEALFEAQGVTLALTPEEAELNVCISRSDDPDVISLFDEGFFVG